MFKHTIEIISIVFMLVCCIHYYVYTKDFKKVILFFGNALLLGTISEALAIILTGGYNYPGYWIYTGPVPLFITLGWGTNFYMTYMVGKQVCIQFEKKKHFLWILGFSCGLSAMLIDLFFDPVAVSLGWWVWKNGSAYFHVPISNFVGWFVFAAGFCMSYTIILRKNEWSFLKKSLMFSVYCMIVFCVTALVSFPFFNMK